MNLSKELSDLMENWVPPKREECIWKITSNIFPPPTPVGDQPEGWLWYSEAALTSSDELEWVSTRVFDEDLDKWGPWSEPELCPELSTIELKKPYKLEKRNG